GRFRQLVVECNQFIPEDLAPQVEAATAWIAEHGDSYCGSLRGWLDDILEGRSRLPPDLSAESMCKLALVRVLERDHLEGYEQVCTACGLQHPYPRFARQGEPAAPRDFFPHGCPHCGTARLVEGVCMVTWAHLVLEQHYPWMDLPGYVGPRPRSWVPPGR